MTRAADGSAGRTRVLVLFGGRSAEHEISCLSARSVVEALDPERHVVTTVGITREGRWTVTDGVPAASEAAGDALPSVSDDGDTVGLVRTRKGARLFRFAEETAGEELGPVDVCFPVLHGPHGEDGTIQGLLASYGIPYVGADVAASAIAIDKRQMKNVFRARELPQVPYEVVRRADWEDARDAALDAIESALTYPLFTKPSRQGSSIGICKVENRDELAEGITEAFGYDRVAVVEQGLDDVRELECAVIGNTHPEVTDPGEIITGHTFYDYEAKYLDEVDLRCPADVSDEVRFTCRDYARRAYLAIGARGMARVDLFYVEATAQVFVNEINTIPGFTPVSMFPHLWQAFGLSYPALVERLLGLAFEVDRSESRYAP